MKEKNKLGIRFKLMMIFSVLIVVVGITGVAVYLSLDSLFKLTEAQSKDLKIIKSLDEIQSTFLDLNLFGMDVVVDAYSDPKGLEQRYQEFESLTEKISNSEPEWRSSFSGLQNGQEGRQIFTHMDKMINAIRVLTGALKQGSEISTKTDEFDEAIDTAKVKGVEIIHQKKVFLEADLDGKRQEIEQIFKNLYLTIIACFGICFLVLALWGIPVGYRLSKSIESLQKDLEIITDGVETTSVNLAESSQTLAESATQASAAIQESVSSMTEMSGMLTQTSRNSTETAQLTREVLEQAHDGVAVMNEMASSMDAISESSSRLKEIVRIIENIATKTNVINDVVFKTQLLAVNASIEAARAGHHGKGFAVVANEVASLAALSGNASAEIRDLLTSSSAYVNEIIEGTASAIKEGERASAKSSESFTGISKSVSMISDKIEQISTATSEQETGVSQTYTALTQMNQATSSTSGLAQKNAQLGKMVSELAEDLWVVNLELKGLVSGSKSIEQHRSGKVFNSNSQGSYKNSKPENLMQHSNKKTLNISADDHSFGSDSRHDSIRENRFENHSDERRSA